VAAAELDHPEVQAGMRRVGLIVQHFAHDLLALIAKPRARVLFGLAS
jgi:hypothetical protein